MIKELIQKLEYIQIRIENIQNSYETASKENSDLVKENNALKLLLEEKNRELVELKEQIKIVKLAQNFTNEDNEGKKELKKKINHYIKEIDKCIDILNN